MEASVRILDPDMANSLLANIKFHRHKDRYISRVFETIDLCLY